MKSIFVLIGLICATTFRAQSAPVKIELPVETAVYKSSAGADLANAQCLTCHSADYASMQPPMPAKFWRGTVEKMIGKYGAPIPTNEVDALVEYFGRNYGTEITNSIAPIIVKEERTPTDAKELMTRNGCFNCHNAQTKLIGPAYKDVAAKYKNNSEALAKVSHQIQNGGSGLWGTFPMPPFKQLSSVEIKILAEWILSQK